MIRRQHVVGFVLLVAAAAPAAADIYGFVDEEGRGHFSDFQVDSRYKLYAKTKPAEAASPVQAASDTPAETAQRTVLPFRPTKAGQRYADMITKVAREQKIDPALLHAVVTVESAYNPRAKSPKGATGLMQVMPATGKRYGITNLLNPLDNLRAGAHYLRDLLALFDNNLRLVIAAYNAGEGAVMRSGNAVPNYPETRAYVPRVLQHYESYRQHYSES